MQLAGHIRVTSPLIYTCNANLYHNYVCKLLSTLQYPIMFEKSLHYLSISIFTTSKYDFFLPFDDLSRSAIYSCKLNNHAQFAALS